MPTIIDSLIVQLGLDSKDVESKAPGVQKKLRDLEKSAEKAESGFKKLSGEIGSFAATLGGVVGAGVFLALAKDIIKVNTHLYYLSENLGMNAQKLYAWGQMARQVGGSVGGVESFFKQTRLMYGQLLTGQSPALLPLFSRMGINALQSPEKIIEQLSERFQGDDKGPNRWKAASFLEASGLPEDVVNIILKGPAWIKSHENELSGLAPSNQQLKSSVGMTEKLVNIGAAINKAQNNLVSTFTPLLSRIGDGVQSILAWLNSHTKAEGALGMGIAGVLGAGSLIGAIRFLMPALEAIAAAFAAVTGPVWAVAAAIAGLGATAYGLYKNWDKVKSFSQDGASSMKNLAMEGWSGIMVGIAKLEGFFSKGKENIPQRANNPGDILYGDFAIKHGATGYIEAQGGKKIATFPDVSTGAAAMKSLLDSPGYSGLTQGQAMERWQTGQYTPLLSGISGASNVASSVSSVTHSSVTHTDNSRNTHIGTVNVQNQTGNNSTSPSAIRGMDWVTLLSQMNYGTM